MIPARCAATLALALLAAPAFAQSGAKPDTLEPAMAAYIKSPQRQAEMAATVRKMIPMVAGACKAAKAAGRTRTQVYKPLTFDRSGQPIAGVFREIVPLDLCGETVELNILASAKPNGTVERINLLPGSSKADPVLQKDALQSAYVAASAGKRCTPFAVRNTAAGEKQPDGRWEETWDMLVCGERVPVSLTFVPTGDGGTTFKAVRKSP